MRKVIFNYFIPGRAIDETKPRYAENLVEGTNCWSGPESGYFHGWGKEIVEGVEGSLAIIEHCITGHVHLVNPERVRFVQPPGKSALEQAIDACNSEAPGAIQKLQNALEILQTPQS